MPSNKKKQLQLLNQIIEMASLEDAEYKRRMIKQHEASKSIGESWMVHHLKALRGLIDNK